MSRPTNFRIDDEDLAAWREEAERADHDLTAFVEEAANAVTPAEARRAHQAVAAAIQAGTLIRGTCEVCGTEKTEAHHDDYAEPLEVRWLCRLHHRAWHKEHPSGVKWDHFNMRLDDETKARWQAWADERGYSLSEFVRACVERKISEDDVTTPRRSRSPSARAEAEISEQPVPERYPAGTTAVPAGGKRTYEPDFKAEGKKKK